MTTLLDKKRSATSDVRGPDGAALDHVLSRIGELAPVVARHARDIEENRRLPEEIVAALKSAPGLDLQIIGSGNLIQTLQAASLIDEYNVWTFPVVLGRGKRLFEAGARAGALRLVASQASATGVVMSTYVPDGEIPHGSFAQAEPSAKEVERRAKLAGEEDRR